MGHVYFHVGLTKAASKYLQRRVFPRLKGLCYIHKHRFREYKTFITAHPENNFLFSTEMDIGIPGRDDNLKKFAADFPDAYPILVLRRQEKWVLSRYKFDLRKTFAGDLKDLFDIDHDRGIFKKKDLFYEKKIDYLTSLFRNKPLVFFQEELLNAPEKVIRMIEDYTGAVYRPGPFASLKTNTSYYTTRQFIRLREFNRRHPFDPKKSKSRTVNRIRRIFREFWADIVLYPGFLLPFLYKTEQVLVSPDELRKIKNFYDDDFLRCVKKVSQDRPVYLPQA